MNIIEIKQSVLDGLKLNPVFQGESGRLMKSAYTGKQGALNLATMMVISVVTDRYLKKHGVGPLARCIANFAVNEARASILFPSLAAEMNTYRRTAYAEMVEKINGTWSKTDSSTMTAQDVLDIENVSAMDFEQFERCVRVCTGLTGEQLTTPAIWTYWDELVQQSYEKSTGITFGITSKEIMDKIDQIEAEIQP